MGIKIDPLFKTKPLIFAVVVMHALPLAFAWYAEALLNQWLPSLFVLLIPLFLVLYTPHARGAEEGHHVALGMKISLMAFCNLVILFLLAYFSTQFQPLISEGDHQALWAVVPGAESMAYVLRLFLQAWLLALVCVMAGRWLTRSPKFSGFLLRFYNKKEILPVLLDFVAFGGTLLVLICIMMFACQQLFYLLSRLMGIDTLFAFPQLSFFIFLFSIFALNKATSFSKRINKYAKKNKASTSLIFLAFIGFFSGTWIFSQVAILGLPDNVQMELAQVFDMRIASLEKFSQNWPLFVLGCSLFMVAPLSILLSRVLQAGSEYLLAVAMAVPVILVAFFLLMFPSVNEAFWVWVPHFHFEALPVTDALTQFHFNGFSIVLMVMALSLITLMHRGSFWMQGMLELSPDMSGRRERRVKQSFAAFFKLWCFLYMIFGTLGVYGLAINVAAYLPTVITLCGVLIYLALYQRFYKRSPINTCMEVNQ